MKKVPVMKLVNLKSTHQIRKIYKGHDTRAILYYVYMIGVSRNWSHNYTTARLSGSFRNTFKDFCVEINSQHVFILIMELYFVNMDSQTTINEIERTKQTTIRPQH